MSCFGPGDRVRVKSPKTKGDGFVTVFYKHDRHFPKRNLLVAWPHTRHVSRVDRSWVKLIRRRHH